jgi:YesN/AraC family two-component response regulator
MQRSVQNVNRESSLFEMIENYMLEHLCEKVTVSDLVKLSGSNKTTITAVFKNSVNMGVIDYFIQLKIDLAKQYLREGNYNISQISDILGYSSVHYFSRQFKKITGMSPSEYSLSIQAIINDI